MSETNYIDCTNNSESLESLFRRLIVIDDDGNLALRTDCDPAEVDCSECFPGGDEGDVLTIVGGEPAWSPPGGGACEITDILYDDLVAAMLGGTLSEGCWYRITDYKTVHYFYDYDPDSGNLIFLPDAEEIISITLTGASGTANITQPTPDGDMIRLVTFDTDLTTTASNFVGLNEGDYALYGITLTSVGDTLYFTGATGVVFEMATIANVSGDLDGEYGESQAAWLAVNEGDEEPLICLATSSETIDSRVYSADYPQDIIHYQPILTAEFQALYSDLYQESTVPGFKGYITYRKDTNLNMETYYDWRNYKFRRWQLNPDEWDVGETYLNKSFIQYLDKVYFNLTESTGDTPTDGDPWVELYDLSDFAYYSWSSISCNGITASAYLWQDFYTFSEGCHNISIGKNYYYAY